MRKTFFILSAMIIILAGCQQSQEKQTAEVSRRDRLIANENLNLINEMKKSQEEIENQKSLVRQCQEEKEKAEQQCNENIKWLMDELPKDLLDDASKLSEENASLLARIADLESQLQKYKSAPQSEPNN